MYTLADIQRKVAPVAKKHGLGAVYLFGSYARGEATDTSDVDLLIDSSSCPYKGLRYLTIITDFERVFGEGSVDVVDMEQVSGSHLSAQNKILAEAILPERKLVYG